MNNNKSTRRTITEEKIANHKLALYASSAISLLVNLLLILVLAADGIAFKYMLFPIVLCAINVLFIAAAVFVNFKFSYSIFYTAVYSVTFILASVVYGFILINFGQEESMSYLSLGLWALVSVVTVVATIIATSGAGKTKLSMKALVGTITLFVCVGVYAYFISDVGFFGQGKDVERPITFVYDDDKEYYVAYGAVDGEGNKITIPETFNGVRVGAIDCSIFSIDGVNKVEIATDADVEFLNPKELSGVDSRTEILVGKATISDISSRLYSIAYQNESFAHSVIEFTRLLSPSDLSGNEVYISFSYDEESIIHSEGHFLPVWIGEKNQIFDISEFSEIPYVNESDANDEGLLARLYNTDSYGGGYILSAIKANGNAISGTKITESLKNVAVSFDMIYRIEVANDNDALYELSDSFRYLDGSRIDSRYRFVTKSTADELLDGADYRRGFSLDWKYYNSENTLCGADSLLDAVNDATSSSVKIYPVWTLSAPAITACKTLDGKTSYVYGDDLTLDAEAISPADGVYLVYEWYRNGEMVASSKSFDIDRVKMTEAGTYRLVVKAMSDSCTSLVSESSRSIALSVDKKLITISWNGLDGTDLNEKVYNAEYSDITVSFDSSAIVYGGDTATYTLSTSKIKNAGIYTTQITLTGDFATKYYVAPAQLSATYTVEKKQVDIAWTVGDYTYTKSEIAPVVAITSGICKTDDITVRTSGQVTPGSYTAVAVLDGSDAANYTLKAAQLKQDYTIKPAVLTFSWTNVTKTYNASNQTPDVTPIGLQGNDTVSGLRISITGGKNAGTYTAKITINNSNYIIADGADTHSFEITPAQIVLKYSSLSLTYNAKTQTPTVTVQAGLCGTDTVQGLSLSVTGAKNVGVYTVSATIANSNYVIQNSTCEGFEIKTAPVDVIWTSERSFTYNGKAQYLAVQSFTGVFAEDIGLVSVETDITSSSNVNYSASAYTSYATLVDSTGNYHLSNSTKTATYNITQRPLTLEWSNLEFDYDGKAHVPTAVIVSGLVAGETVELSYSDGKINAGNGYTATVSITDTNYTVANPQASFKIKQKKIDVLWSGTEFTYDGQSHAPVATVSAGSVVDGDTVTINVSGGQKNAGQHTATASSKNQNYTLNNPTASFKIERRSITISWNNTTFTYNAKTQTPSAQATVAGNMVSGDSVVISVSGGQKNVGSYVATATTSNTNYYIDNSQEAFVISPITVDVEFSNTSRTYNGSNQKPTVSLKGAPAGDDYKLVITVDADVNGAKNVGVYTAEVYTDNSNYVLNSATSVCEFKITKKTLSATWLDTTQTYNGTELIPDVKLSGVVSTDSVEYTLLIDGTQGGRKNFGVYTATISINETNYELDPSVTTRDFKITKKTISAIWSNTNPTYNGTALSPEVSFDGVVAGDSISCTLLINGVSDGMVNAGNYNATVSIDELNYALDTSTASRDFKIARKSVRAIWSNTAQTYSGIELKPEVSFEGVLPADDVSCTLLINGIFGGIVDAGSYTATVSIGNLNYTLDASTASCSFVIKAADVTVSFEGTLFVYDGGAKTPVATTSVSGITLTYKYEKYDQQSGSYGLIADAPVDAGAYRVTVSTSDTNYALIPSTVSATFVIEAASATVSFDKTVFTYDGGAKTPVATTSVSGIKLTYKYEKYDQQTETYVVILGAPVDAGAYRVTVGTSDTNYTLENASATFTVVAGE